MKKIYKIVPIAIICFGLTSCLKDDLYTADTNDSPNLIDFKDAPDINPTEELIYPVYSEAFDYKDEIDYNITVNYSGVDNAPEDIVVELLDDASAVTKFNTQVINYAREQAIAAGTDPAKAVAEAQSKLYTLAPSNFYTIPSKQVTIKKGERAATFVIKVKPKLIDFDHQYALPLVIKSASGGALISGTFGTALFNIGSKNQYDGEYSHTYTSSLGNGSNTVVMTTKGANAVTYTLLGVYSNPVQLTIDPATNLATVSMTSLLPIATDPSSHYDPATKTFYLKWTSNGGRRSFEETFVRKGE
ncbi:DUF1735 domain-containing protein [Arcticibacter tournemirensis]|uniref:DUF1735 domain-containing protein n=1 Tax=Arcticibacter tournemirensis TaxID=699437 RepID=A0A4Q0MF64_9SPHI|nr:DUF1735 domain-containing protein [Arcticibacter tournemirensis]RXF71925.1 DUF1735 domain-containing protein [Arcticibacter tournemirensis]